MEYLKRQFGLNLGYDEINFIKAKLVIEEKEDADNPIILPNDNKYYTIKFVSEENEVIADRDDISFKVWLAIKKGMLKDGDWVGIETDCIVKEFKGKVEILDDGWVPIYYDNDLETLSVLYSKVKKDGLGNVTIHNFESNLENIEYIGNLNARINLLEGLLEGIIAHNDLPKEIEDEINKYLNKKE